jgi:hypothetical protein
VQENGGPDPDGQIGLTVERAAIVSLQLAWADSIRDEWETANASKPEWAAQWAVAKELMLEAGFDDRDPICGLPGVKPMVATVDGQAAVSFEHSMVNVAPLSAIFLNKLRESLDVAARVSDALAKQAEPKPDAGPAEEPAPEVRQA